MAIVWRGIGIVVPIIFFIVGWIVSYFFDGTNTKILNADFLSWTSLFSGILIALIGLGLKVQPKEEASPYAHPEPKPKGKHDFFFIPVIYWGIGLLILCIYLFFFAKPAVTPNTEQIIIEEKPTTRIVNFYNPTEDTLKYIVADDTDKGLIESKYVAPGEYISLELLAKSYLFGAFDMNSEKTLSLPVKKHASDTSKYVLLKDDKGSFYQRKVYAQTSDKDDYDEAWLVLDGKHDLALVEITNICKKRMDEVKINEIEWSNKIYDIYDAEDLIEPLFKKPYSNKTITVIAPGKKIPISIEENELVYLLVPFTSEYPKDSLIAGKIIESY